MKHFALSILIIIALAFSCFGQVNYVMNPGFEILTACPSSVGQIGHVDGWNTPVNGGGGSPDAFNICCTYPPECGVPTQADYNSSQNPHSGNGYCDIQVTGSGTINYWREYIQSKLIHTLVAKSTYCVTFYASLCDQCEAYITPLGAYFDDGSISALPTFHLAIATPQVFNTAQPLSDKVNWMKIEGSFMADSNQDYITIGNFSPDSLSDIGLIDSSMTGWVAYYYIDDVSVIDADLSAHAGNDTLIHPGDSVFIGRPSEVGLDEDCIWFVGGVAIDTVAGLWVKPDSSTTYVVQQTICGNVKYDTIHITVSGVGLEQYEIHNKHLQVYPNPTKDEFYVEYSGDLNGQQIEVGLYTMYGSLVKQVNAANQTKFSVSTRDLSPGIYFYKVSLGNNTIGKDKIVIIK